MKVFTGVKRLDSYILNVMGIQVIRIIVYKIKSFVLNFIYNGRNALKRNKLSKYGFLEIPDIFINFNLIDQSRSQFFSDKRLNCYHLLGADY